MNFEDQIINFSKHLTTLKEMAEEIQGCFTLVHRTFIVLIIDLNHPIPTVV